MHRTMGVQDLFDQYNNRYWRGRLPRYKVLVTDRYTGGRCEKRQRMIYINPSTPAVVSRTLLHEMAHAAVRGNGHNKVWLNEVKRIVRLGAPLKQELAGYASKNAINREQVLGEFYDAGCEADDTFTWRQLRRSLGYEYGYVDKEGRAADKYAAQFLEQLRREWLRGRAQRRRFQKATERFSTVNRF